MTNFSTNSGNENPKNQPRPSPPVISIGLPVYNGGDYISRAIDSLLSQTYKNLEIVISDNHSNDGTHEICARYAKEYPHIVYSRNEENLGILKNFQIVRQKARGKYFAWMGADDILDPQFVMALYRALEEEPNSCVAMCSTIRVKEDGSLIDIVRYSDMSGVKRIAPLQQARRLITVRKKIKDLKYNLYILGLYRKEFLDTVLDNDPSILTGGDRVLPAIAALSGGLCYVDKPLYIKTVHSESWALRNPEDPRVKVVVKESVFRLFINLNSWLNSAPTIPNYRKPTILIVTSLILIRYYVVQPFTRAIGVFFPKFAKDAIRRFL